MGCNFSVEELNNQFRESIQNLDYSNIQFLLNQNESIVFDPSLIHLAVKSGQIDLVAILVEHSKFIRI